MPDPVIQPPVPTVNQTDSPEQIAETAKNVMNIFDKVAPPIKGSEPTVPIASPDPAAAGPAATPPVTTSPPEASKPPETSPQPSVTEPPKLPSFIEQALKSEPSAPAAPDEAFPETPPEFKTPEERNARYNAWRKQYNTLKEEVKTLRNQPQTDPQTTERLTFLEGQNKELNTQLSRFNVEGSRQFHDQVIAPMTQAWNEAARIVKEAGGEPNDLAKALSLSGKAHFEALDSIFEGLPESAKMEAQQSIATYRRFDEVRRNALADPVKTNAELQKAQIARQQEFIAKQKVEMGTLFDEAVRKLRDEAGVEVLRTSSDPDASQWNDNADNLVKTARALFLDNSDMGRMAMACVLAPLADSYRKMWFAERQAREAAEKTLKDKFGSEPNLGESGGAISPAGSTPPLQEDLKRPFKDVFLREFRKAQAAGVR